MKQSMNSSCLINYFNSVENYVSGFYGLVEENEAYNEKDILTIRKNQIEWSTYRNFDSESHKAKSRKPYQEAE